MGASSNSSYSNNAFTGAATGRPTKPVGTQASFSQDPAGNILGKLGFGPGSSWTPAQAASQNEAARQRGINRTDRSINSIFSNPARQQQYAALGKNTTDYYLKQLNQQRDRANRQLKFGLAEHGMTGGSQAAFDTGMAGKDYQQGLLTAANRGQSASASLRAQDQQARNNLLSMAQSGMDLGTASQRANEMMLNNYASTAANARVNALGNVFGNLSDQYMNYQNAQERNALTNQVYQNLYNLVPGGY